jgi:deoxyribonuclease-4
MQIFSHNPRQWAVRYPADNDAASLAELRKSLDISPLYVHTSYLINLAAGDAAVLKKSKDLLQSEMDLADLLGAEYVVLHTGSASGTDEGTARKRAIGALRDVLGLSTWRTRLLLENTAGERGDISSRIVDLSEIIRQTESPHIGGVCIDTCHAFSAGYDIATQEGIGRLAAEIGDHLGPGSVKLVHLNDSKKGRGSKVDRHEHIGRGGIGMEGLRRFVNHPAFRDVPLILETPKKSKDDDRRNLAAARGLLQAR